MKLEQLLTLSTISKELTHFCVSVLDKQLTKYFTIICSQFFIGTQRLLYVISKGLNKLIVHEKGSILYKVKNCYIHYIFRVSLQYFFSDDFEDCLSMQWLSSMCSFMHLKTTVGGKALPH